MKLLYPNDQKRAFYQEGDIVLLSDMRPSDAAMQFPELAGESESTLLVLAMGFLGEEPPDYKCGWKIKRMGAEGPPGDAQVSLIGVIFFDRDVVELSRTREMTARELGLEFEL